MSMIYIPTANGYEQLGATDVLSKNRCIWINGTVQGDLIIETISALLHFAKESDEEITMLIHSNGGSIQDGLAIYDVMKAIKAPIKTVAVGMAASMGAVLLAAGTKGRRFVLPSSKVMIHQPLISGMGATNVSDIIELGEHMKGIKQMINQILSECIGRTIDEVDEACKTEHFYSASEAVEFGLVDGIVDGTMEWF